MKLIDELIINPGASIKDAMEKMTQSRKGVLVVLNERGQLAGVVSDGDVRRALLNNILMTGPVVHIMNTNPVSSGSEEQALSLLQEGSLILVPVVDQNRVLKSIALQLEGAYSVLTLDAGEKDLAVGEILILIPARGGSKRVAHKNLQKIGGYSLVARAILAAQDAFPGAYVLVSTDDKQIAREAEKMGAQVPWMRPPELATDSAGSFGVVEHALKWAVSNLKSTVRTVVLLEPTAPLRTAEHVREAVSLLHESNADSVVSVSEVPHVFNPEEILSIGDDGSLQPYKAGRKMHTRAGRQEQEKVFVQNGIVYAIAAQTILKCGNLYGEKVIPYVVEWKYFADIDEPADLVIAESRLKIL